MNLTPPVNWPPIDCMAFDLLEGRRPPLPPMDWVESLGFVFTLLAFDYDMQRAVWTALCTPPTWGRPLPAEPAHDE